MKTIWKCLNCGRKYTNNVLEAQPAKHVKKIHTCPICFKGPMVNEGPIYTTKKEVREE